VLCKSEAGISAIDALQRRLARLASGKRIAAIALAEKRASANYVAFESHCVGLKAHCAGLLEQQRSELLSALDSISGLLRSLTACGAVEHAAALFYSSNCTDEDAAQLWAACCGASVPALDSCRTNSLELKRMYWQFDSCPEERAELCRKLSTQLCAEENCWQAAVQYADVFRYLLGGRTERSMSETELCESLYTVLRESNAAYLSETPAHLLLGSLLQQHYDSMASGLLCACTVASFFWRFASLSSALERVHQISQHFQALTRVGNLLGLRVSPSLELLGQYCVQLMPHLSSEHCVESGLESQLREAEQLVEHDSMLQCWSYVDAARPWLPCRVRSGPLLAGPYGVVRADTVLAPRRSDLWLYWKWSGIDVEATSDTELQQLRTELSSACPSELGQVLLQGRGQRSEQYESALLAKAVLCGSYPPFYGAESEAESQSVSDWPEL
jgi:hypothetical protein